MDRVTDTENTQDQGLAVLLKRIFLILPLGYLVIFVTSLFTNDQQAMIILAILTIVNILSYQLVKRGYLQTSVTTYLAGLTSMIVFIGTVGEGVHDIAIIVFSCILVMASLFLDIKNQVSVTVFCLAGIWWLAMGEYYGIFQREGIGTSTISDLVIVLTILALSTFITQKLSDRLRKVLSDAEAELQDTEKLGLLLNETLDSKKKLSLAVHQQVADSLSIFRGLVKNDLKNEPSLVQKIQVIEAAHLSVSRHEEDQINFDDFIDHLKKLGRGSTFRSIKSTGTALINVDQAVSIGFFISEVLKDNDILSLDFEIIELDEELKITILGTSLVFKETLLIQTLVLQLKGRLDPEDQAVHLCFQKIKAQ